MTNLPFNGKFTVTCEYRTKGSWQAGFHTGIDLVGKSSKYIYSVCNGKVIMTSSLYGAYGKTIKIKDNQTGRIFLFAHLSKIYVKKGQKVTRATKIGVMGNTGNSTGPHLHIEMRTSADKYGVVENIADYMGIPNKKGIYNSDDYQFKKDIYYKAHIQDIGWQDLKKNWETAGTEGKGKRIEAIAINSSISLKYRVHMEEKGWSNWLSNGEIAGTVGESRRIEAIEIIAEKPIKGQAHVQNEGWQKEVVGSPIILGTTGKGLRLEAFRLEVL